jgi:hypothetical protein
MVYKAETQPYCRVCGKAIAKHVVTVWIEKADADRTHHRDSWYSRHAYADNIKSKADCQRLTNHKVVSVHYWKEDVRRFGEWDGESYVDEYFCNGAHARDFAYMAAREYPGLRTQDAANAEKARTTKQKEG